MASEAAEKWYEEQFGPTVLNNRDEILQGFDAGTASQREVMACGHPKACLDHDCHHCCQFQESNGKLPHDCKVICTACEEVRQLRAGRYYWAGERIEAV
jgi:hypothetical protein